MEGRKIEIVVLGMNQEEEDSKFVPTAYLACYPRPYLKKELGLYRQPIYREFRCTSRPP